MIELAFLAPDILRKTLDGRQPLGFTSDWCMRHALPADWNEQRALLATLWSSTYHTAIAEIAPPDFLGKRAHF